MPPNTCESPGEGSTQLYHHPQDVPAPNSSQHRLPPRIIQNFNTPSSSPKPTATNHVPFLERLRVLPEVRPIPWRPGQELPPERSIESPRVQQRGAILLATRGQESKPSCTHCEAGYGRFSACITLDNWFQGACSSCIFTSKGNKCSLRHQVSGNADGRALRYHTDNPEVLETVIRNAAENPKPAKKRKRRPTEKLVDNLVSTLPESPDLDTLLQAEIAREQDDPVRQLKPKQKRQSKSLPASTYPTYAPHGGSFHQDAAHPATASETLKPEPRQATLQKQPQSANTSHHSANAPLGPSVPIIDTFPKGKQRQIYGFISGVSNGIQNMQKELDSLKAVLGIDDDGLPQPR